MSLADTLLSAYIRERRHRRNPYPRCSAGFAGARFVSRCHRAETYESRRSGKIQCVVCGQPCELQNLEQRATPLRVTERWHRQTIEVPLMAVNETRVVDRDAEDRAMVSGTWRYLALARLIEPRPRSMSDERWRYVLVAWGLALDFGRERGAMVGGQLFSGRGTWTPGAVRVAMEQGREVVGSRAERRPLWVESLVGRDAA